MSPTIDVHTHLFSALDIPLEGYLLSRRSERRIGRMIDPWISVFPMPQLFGYVARRARERCVTRRLEDDVKRGWFYSAILWLYGKLAGQRFLDWEDSLTRYSGANADQLIATWPSVDLFVPLMIDYEYWFANSLDNSLGDQVETVFRDVVLPHLGKIHPFAPFDPAREIAYRKGMVNPDGQLETYSPLKTVKDAVESKGFIGVKLYNSLGYRPLGNADPDLTLKRRHIAIRNQKLPFLFDGEEYDEVLCELYDFCVDNDVPITAHCVMDGIEAYPDASLDFGRAIFWDEVLRQDRYKDLHLNLAHFGWNQSPGQGYAGTESWARDVCELIVKHDHVYADVSHHRVLTESGRDQFITGYRQMMTDFSTDIEKIKSRILFGSDWHVLKRMGGYRDFLEHYQHVLVEAGIYDDNELDRFRGGNALEFLGLLPGGANRDRLLRLYQSHGESLPGWYQLAGRPPPAPVDDSPSARRTTPLAGVH
jgi:predicted TIM-barrel fold metal-dependent hydrolase